MANMAEIELWYYIDGKTDVSSVFVSPNDTIDDLKTEIYEADLNAFPECNAQDLILTKVCYIMISTNIDVTNGICWPITPAGR